jgi:hypothetical protein
METVQLIIFIALGAVLIEAVVNALEVFKGFSPTKEWFAANWQYLVALVVSILAAVTYNLDFFDALGFDARIPYVGIVFTGIIISRGSNYANDIISRVRAISQPKSSVTITAEGEGVLSSETAVTASMERQDNNPAVSYSEDWRTQ